jgi:hypothetical protein
MTETSQRTLQVQVLPGKGMAAGQERVLRGDPVTGTAKRRQRVQGPCDRAPKGNVVGAEAV